MLLKAAGASVSRRSCGTLLFSAPTRVSFSLSGNFQKAGNKQALASVPQHLSSFKGGSISQAEGVSAGPPAPPADLWTSEMSHI